METNPYAAPAAVVDDVPRYVDGDLQSHKASRGRRLGAVLIDGLINVVWLTPVVWGVVMEITIRQGLRVGAPVAGPIGFGLFLLLVLFVINCVLIYRHGQTIGKRALNIAMVRSNGDRMGLARYIFLRVMPVSLLAGIPYVGGFVWLVDVLLIFGTQRRCLHDLIADTIVIDV